MGRVDGTPCGQRIKAWIVLKEAQPVATIHAYYSPTGAVLVNVFNHSDEARSYQEAWSRGRGFGVVSLDVV